MSAPEMGRTFHSLSRCLESQFEMYRDTMDNLLSCTWIAFSDGQYKNVANRYESCIWLLCLTTRNKEQHGLGPAAWFNSLVCFSHVLFYLNLYSVSLLPCKSWNKLENCRNKSTTVVVKRGMCVQEQKRTRKWTTGAATWGSDIFSLNLR